MSEIITTIALLGIGYIFTKKDKKEVTASNMENKYTKLIDAEKIKQENAHKLNQKPDQPRTLEKPIVPPNSSKVDSKDKELVSQLSGLSITEKEFMTRDDGQVNEPFVSGQTKQSLRNIGMPNRLLEPNGISQYDCKKTETKPFFAPTSNLTYPNGTPANDESIMERQYVSNNRNGELPFKQVRVGPGLGGDYESEGRGGFQQFETQSLIRPKTVDELRTQSNPKLQYRGRINPGKRRNDSRAAESAVDKNRPDTFYENSQERYFTSQASVLAQSSDPNFIMNNTNRQNSRFFVGGMSGTEREEQRQEVKESTRNNYKGPDMGGAYSGVNKPNYGKASYKAYANERDITQKRTNKLNIAAAVKSLIVPLQDLVKKTRKENFVGNNRPDGNMKASMPNRQTVYDPNDLARTTIKETTIDNKHTGQAVGPVKLTVYDANDVARTTIKETTIDNKHSGQVSNNNQKPKMTKYDDEAKRTLRETLDEWDYNKSVKPNGPEKLQTFNRKNPPKKTIKETTVEDSRAGFLGGGYDKGGYMVDPAEAPNTSKQFMSDNEYTGGANSLDKKPSNYQAQYNARLNVNKEQVAKGRAPTQQGAKVANGGDKIKVLHKKQMSGVSYPKVNKSPGYINTAGEVSMNLSHHKDQLENGRQVERINPEVLEALNDNPYVQSYHSSGPSVPLSAEETIPSGNDIEEERRREQEEIDRLIEMEIARLD